MTLNEDDMQKITEVRELLNNFDLFDLTHVGMDAQKPVFPSNRYEGAAAVKESDDLNGVRFV